MSITHEDILAEALAEYEASTGRDFEAETARAAFEWLRDHTDTFDPVILRIALDLGSDIKPDRTMINEWVEGFTSGEPLKPEPRQEPKAPADPPPLRTTNDDHYCDICYLATGKAPENTPEHRESPEHKAAVEAVIEDFG